MLTLIFEPFHTNKSMVIVVNSKIKFEIINIADSILKGFKYK